MGDVPNFYPPGPPLFLILSLLFTLPVPSLFLILYCSALLVLAHAVSPVGPHNKIGAKTYLMSITAVN